uniref:GAG-pre-integrase domain-containing protein n=1 Tax=Tanacetum cinerariifolium TaxID=118510 RepID=A0A699HU89_TANCI|nr:hypothetical protein [Tanacetum cinerariifolium]
MSTQQDIYAVGSENRPLMLNKDNYVPWSSRIIRYARSRPNGKMIVDSIKNGPYVRQMISIPGEPDLPVHVPVPESFHEQTDEELTKNDLKQMDADDQAIQTILLGLPEDVYVVVDSCETTKEIWECVQQMMKGSDIGEQDKKANHFNEWEKFTSTDGESIESYYHHFMQLMNDLKRNNISQKTLHRISNEPGEAHKDQSSSSTHSQQSFPINNKYNPQPSLNQNFMQPPMTSLEDINDPTEAMNAAPTNNNQTTSSNPRNHHIAQSVMNIGQDRQIQNVGGNGWNQFGQYAGQNAGVQSGGNQNGLVVVPRIANHNGTGNVVVASAEGTGNGNQARCYNCRGLGHIATNWIQLQAEEFNFMAAAGDLDEIEEVNANYILMANLQHASTFGTQHDKAPVYDTDGSAEVHLNDNCYDNKIFNMFTQEEQYTDLLEPIPEPQLVPQNDNHVTLVSLSMVQSGGTVEISSALNEETRAYQETVYHNLVDQVAQVNMVNCNTRATNAELKSELARYKIQEQRVEINQDFAKQITTLNDEISDLNKQLSKEKSSISSLMEEKKKLKHDFKTREDKFLDQEVDLKAIIKDLENILLKMDQTIQTMHMLNPKPDLFYHPNQKMALGYQNPSYLKKAQMKQQSLYNGNLLLEEHDPPAVYDSEETLKLAQERVFVPQTTKSKEELFLSNVSNMVTVFKTISIPNEDLSDDATPSVARKFLNKAKSSLVTLQHVVKQKITLEVHNWSSSAHKEVKQLQAQLRDLKGKSSDIPSASNILDPLNQKLESKIVELEFQAVNYKRKISHLKTTYKNREFDVMKHRNVIDLGMFKINPSQTPMVDLVPNKQSSASIRTNPITNSQRHVIVKENVSSNRVIASSTGLVHTARTRRLQPKGNSRNVRVPSASKSSEVKKNVTVEEHRRTLLLSKNQKTMSSECNNIKLAIRNDKSKIVCANCCSKRMTGNIKLLITFVWKFLGTVRFGLGHNLFLVGQFCDADLKVAFMRNTCFIRDLDGVDLLKGNRSTNLYTINLYDIASTSPICLMARATPTKSWLWHQRLSHLNFDTINELAKNDLVSSLPKFKYSKEHLCPSFEQGKSKRASHPPKLVSNSKHRLHFLHMDLCGPMLVASFNGK